MTESTNASGLFVAVMVGLFIGAVCLYSGVVDRVAWAMGGGW